MWNSKTVHLLFNVNYSGSFSFRFMFFGGTHYAAVLQGISKRFFVTFRQMNYLKPRRDRFFDFDLGHVAEAGKVENCRFLENCSMDFDEKQAA